jgi:hypothetical protein
MRRDEDFSRVSRVLDFAVCLRLLVAVVTDGEISVGFTAEILRRDPMRSHRSDRERKSVGSHRSG